MTDEEQLRLECLSLATRVGQYLVETTVTGAVREDCVERARRYYEFVRGEGDEATALLKTVAEWAGVLGPEGR